MATVIGKSYLMAAGATGTIAYPTQGQNPGAWTLTRLTNASPFPVQLRLGGIYLDTLPAWTANTYPLLPSGIGSGAIGSSPAALTFAAVSPANAPTIGAGDSTLYSDFGLYGDQFPGSYPQPLAGQAVAAAISGSVTSQPPLNGVLYSGNFPTPKLSVANAGALGIKVTCGASFNVNNTNHTFKITWFAADQTTVLFTETWNQFASPGGNGPFSTLLDIFPVFGPFFQVTSTAGTGPATIAVWATNLAGSFERPSPQTYLTYNNVAIGAGITLQFELGTGGQTLPANVALSPDSFYVPGDIDLYAQINAGSGLWQIQELITQSGTFVIKQTGTLGVSTADGPIRFTIGRNTPLFVMANTSGVAGNGFADLSAVRGN